MKLIATNRKASHDYYFIETMECGVKLIGCEVKSIRAGLVNLKDSYCSVDSGSLVVHSMYIAPYDKGSYSNCDSRRDRTLLMHRSEINRLIGKCKEKGYTLVPTKLYFTGSLVKMEVALAKGKMLYDKRDSIAKRDMDRDQARQLRDYDKSR